MVILRATNENGLKSDLDVLENDAPIKLDISAIENATIGSVFGASSQTFSLPGTDRNNQFFGNLFDLGTTPAVALQDSIPCQVLTDGQEVFTGKLYITDIITDQKGYTTYQVNVVNETVDFKFLLTDVLLSELDWSAYNHNYTYNNIISSWIGNLFSGSIVYPNVNYGTPEGNTTLPSYTLGGGARCFDNLAFPLQINQFKPAIQVKTVIDTIFDSVDYKYTSSFIDSEYFGNLYMLMTPNDGLGVYNANPTTGSAWAFRSGSNQTFNALVGTKVNFNAEVYDTYNRFNLTNDRYVAYTNGLYNFAVGFTYSISNYNVNNRLRFRVQLRKNGGLTGPSKNFVDVPQAGQIYAPFANIQLNNTDFVELFIELTTDDGTEVITISFGQNQTYFKVIGPQSTAGGLVDMGLQFPNDLKCLDFMQGLIEKFNLVVEPTPGFRNQLTIEPFTDWVTSGTIVDWTDKVDRSQRFKIVHPITEQPKQINFRDADDEAVINKYNFDNFGDVFGSYIYENESDLPIGERNIGKIFAATPVKGVLNGDTMIIPHLCRKDNSGRELPFKFKPRLLYNNGLQDMPVTAGTSGSIIVPQTYFIIDESFVTHVESEFLQMTTFEYIPTDASGSISGSRDLHFGNLNWWQYFQNIQTGKTTEDAYHVYWASYINSLYDIDARKLTCNVYLKPTELQGIQLNDKIFIDGHYYRINKINGANLSYRDSVEVELIKELNRLLPYPRRRVLNNNGTAVDILVGRIELDGSVVYEEYDGGATVEDYGLIQQAGFKDGFAVFNDNNTGSVTWNVPASVTADTSRIAFGENQLDDSVGLVLVAGSNNNVQTQTENSLINGSNNTLNAGSKNATIIGTNNTIDILTENVSIIGSSNSSVTGPNNSSMLVGGDNSTLTNTDFCISINADSGSTILDSDFTTAINSHQNEVIVNGSGHAVIGLNLEGAGLDLLNYRNNSNWLGDTYSGGATFTEFSVLQMGSGAIFLTGSNAGEGKHDSVFILNWSGLSPATSDITLPSSTNSDYKKIKYTFITNGTFDGGTQVRLLGFSGQLINGVSQYTLQNAYESVTLLSSGSGWITTQASSGGSGGVHFGSFYDTTDQTATVANTAYSMSFNSTDIVGGVTLASGSRIYPNSVGTFDIQFSAQLKKNTGGDVKVYIWLAKNGTNVANTNSSVQITGGSGHEVIAAWNFFAQSTALTDYFELRWGSDTAGTTLDTQTPAVGPGIPSIILTVDQIS